MKTRVLACTAALATALSAGCVVSVDSQGQIVRDEKKFTVSGTPELHLTTFDGSIEVRGWDRPDVAVEIEKRGPTRETVDTIQVESSQSGNRIELEVKRPRRESISTIGFHRSASARLIVSVPKRSDVIARSGDGSIRIDGVSGRLELRTGDGSIRAVDVSGQMVLHTGDGSVVVDNGEGSLDVDTGDGGVNVTGRFTQIKMHTGDGAIVCRAQPGTSMAEPWEISTGDGSVSLYLPSDFSADLDAHTGDGSIRNDLTIERSVDEEKSRRSLKARLGAGGKVLRVRTGDGSIRLRAS